MIHELRHRRLSDAAHELGIDPFEVVRLMVVTAQVPDQLRLAPAALERLRNFAGIERWWTAGLQLPEDANPRRGLLRAVLAELLRREHVGDRRTRIDNLWRGLENADQQFLEPVINCLVEQGLISSEQTVSGVEIAVRPEAVKRVTSLASGDLRLPAVDNLCGE